MSTPSAVLAMQKTCFHQKTPGQSWRLCYVSRSSLYAQSSGLWMTANLIPATLSIIVYKEVTQALTLSSYHTKHWLEDNDPTKPAPDKIGNIRVFRHPGAYDAESNGYKHDSIHLYTPCRIALFKLVVLLLLFVLC